MADNATLQSTAPATPASGVILAADDIGGVLYPRTKISLGADGSAADAPGDGTNGMLVNLGTNNDVTLNASTAIIGSLAASTAVIGSLAASTASIGSLAASTAVIGSLAASTAVIGSLAASTASIGLLGANSGVDIGDVTLTASTASIGSLAASTAAIGLLGANSGVDIGDVDVTSVPADPFGTNGDAAASTGSISAKLRFIAATGIPTAASGGVAHDAVDAGNPVKVGARAIAHGANPTAVAAADRTDLLADVHGRLFVKNTHPNLRGFVYLSTAAQTDDNVLAALSTSLRYGITRCKVALGAAVTTNPSIRLGFGSTGVPALPASGGDAVEGFIGYHPGIVPGSMVDMMDSGGDLLGAAGEELRITCDIPTSGTLSVMGSFYTIDA